MNLFFLIGLKIEKQSEFFETFLPDGIYNTSVILPLNQTYLVEIFRTLTLKMYLRKYTLPQTWKQSHTVGQLSQHCYSY